jgi:hypothetical protein
MKKLIYQYYWSIPEQQRTNHIMSDSNKYYTYSEKSIKKYAEKCGADYKFGNKEHPVHPFYGIFLPFTEGWCHDYDVICWIDADILATKHSKNVFDLAAEDRISANFMNTQARWKNSPDMKWWSDKGHINSGVVVFPKSVYAEVSDFVSDLDYLHKNRTIVETSLGNFDQAQVNKIVKKMNKYKALDDEMNYHLGRKDMEGRWSQSLIHYWRQFKPNLISDFNDDRILK